MSDLLPPNATPLERAISLVGARVEDVPVPIATLDNPDACPAPLLPWLAWAESVDDWFTTWTEAQKRSAIKASFGIHAKKGTAGALKLAVGALGYDVEVIEWFQETVPAEPYTFRCLIIVDQDPIPNADAFDQIVSVANATKNLRSRTSGVDIKALTRCDEFIGGAAWLGEIITIAAEPA